MPRFFCRHPTCNRIIERPGWCPVHQAREQEHRAERHRLYDATRDPEIVRFYRSKEWLALRESQLREHPICQRCEREIATQVHHVESLRLNWERRVDSTNAQCLCGGCHKKIEAAIRRAYANAAPPATQDPGGG